MKKYIGTKVIEAEPMTGFEAMLNGFNTGNCIDAGYHICYEADSEDWLPKDVFEKTYKIADTLEDRLVIERQDLADKLLELSSVINNENFEDIVTDIEQRVILIVQKNYMNDYLEILDKRIKTIKD